MSTPPKGRDLQWQNPPLVASKPPSYFDLQEANELLLEHQQRDINAESIRARIYEGIDKGLFERVGKGLYSVKEHLRNC